MFSTGGGGTGGGGTGGGGTGGGGGELPCSYERACAQPTHTIDVCNMLGKQYK
jgi:hypothetical protein